MKAHLTSWNVEQLGPAPSTRQEQRYADGSLKSVSFEAIHDVTLRFTVVGNDAMEFLESVQQLGKGAAIKRIVMENKTTSRKYIFD